MPIPSTKIYPEQKAQILAEYLSGVTQTDLAAKYQVAPQLVSRIVKGAVKGAAKGRNVTAPIVPQVSQEIIDLRAVLEDDRAPVAVKLLAFQKLKTLENAQISPLDDDRFDDPFACDQCKRCPCECPETVAERAARLQHQQDAREKEELARQDRLLLARETEQAKEALRATYRELLASGDERTKACEIVLRNKGWWVDQNPPRIVTPPRQSAPIFYPAPERTEWDDRSSKREAETMRPQTRRDNVVETINWLNPGKSW